MSTSQVENFRTIGVPTATPAFRMEATALDFKQKPTVKLVGSKAENESFINTISKVVSPAAKDL